MVARAVALAPEGPYTHDKVVIPPQAHNPYYAQDPVSKMHLIFHIGLCCACFVAYVRQCDVGVILELS